MEQLAEGLWWWTAPHAEWTPADGGPDGWQREVSSYAFDLGDVFVLVDPQSPPSLVDELAEGRPTAVALTCAWHRRSTDEVIERVGASTGRLPDGVESAVTLGEDTVLWIPAHAALVFGDTLIAEPDALRIPDAWLRGGETHAGQVEALRPLLDLPVEHVLPTHGRPGTRGDLERALLERLES